MNSRIQKISIIFLLCCVPMFLQAQENEECMVCHKDKESGAPLVNSNVFEKSIHENNLCISCHSDLKGMDFPHDKPLKVSCGNCHLEQQKLYSESLHGKAVAKGDKLAPLCQDCHGSHDILKVKDKNSAVSPIKVPFVCGKCHQEGAPVQSQRNIHQSKFLRIILRVFMEKDC